MTYIYNQNYTGYVYLWFDKKRKMFYVGSHLGSVEDSYIASNKWLKNSYNKCPNDFKMRVLEYTTGDIYKLHEREQYWLDMINDTELSTSKNVAEGNNRYYNMKKNAFGGSHKGHTKKRIKPAWNKGISLKMIQLRKNGLFQLLIDKPKDKRTYRSKSTRTRKKSPPVTKHCIMCGHTFTVEFVKRKRKKCCSLHCARSYAATQGNSASNGRCGAKKLSKAVTGRKRRYLDNGSWTWIYPKERE